MKYIWYIIQVLLVLVSGFFLVFGIDLLRASYTLDNPYSFIMTFFSASFIILTSLALGISFIIKIIRVSRRVFRQVKHTPSKD